MGLIMLILVGTVPTAYALNHTVGAQDVTRPSPPSPPRSPERSTTTKTPHAPLGEATPELEKFVADKKFEPQVINLALEQQEDH